MSLNELSATQARRKLGAGEMTSEQLVGACLDHIGQVDGDIEAWTHLSPDYALQQARTLDDQRAKGGPLGPLHGIPVGIKDIFDTADLPTENGTILDRGRQPTADCKVVSLLKEAGAVIMGKTVTTELAVFGPGKTKNPHNPEHTPGGSSSGSAAAVASFMVPLAIGTQTNGSMLRPASFCGVMGFKPTHGLIPRTGVLAVSGALDTIGTFARSIDDIALLSEALIAFDAGDRDTRARAHPALCETLLSEPPGRPVVGFAKTPVWDQAAPETRVAFEEFSNLLGDDCAELTMPEPFDHLVDMHRKLMNADMAKNLARYYDTGKDKLTDTICDMIEAGHKVSAVEYMTAVEGQDLLGSLLDGCFDHCDMIITPPATGEAPKGLAATGNPIFNTLATYCKAPSITLPLLQGPSGLPLGVQVIGRRGEDARLLRNANWLMQRVAG